LARELDELRLARAGTTPDEIALQKLEDKDRYYALGRPEVERMPAPDAGSRPLDAASKSRAGGAAAAKPAESAAQAGPAQPKDAKGLGEQYRTREERRRIDRCADSRRDASCYEEADRASACPDERDAGPC
jgi:hypothetical protein